MRFNIYSFVHFKKWFVFYLIFVFGFCCYAQATTQQNIDSLINKAGDSKNFSAEDIAASKLVCVVDNNNGTFMGSDGTIWQVCLYGQVWENGRCEGNPKTVSWYEAMTAAKNNKFAGKNDWILPTKAFLNGSINTKQCKHPNISMYIRESRYAAPQIYVNHFFWTALANGGKADITNESFYGGYSSVYYDTNKSASELDKSYNAVHAIFVRNAPEEDKQNFIAAYPNVICSLQCRAERKVTQEKKDTESDRRAAEKMTEFREKFLGGNNNTSTSTSSTGPNAGLSVGVASVRREMYDNVGRKTEGYWVKCANGRETRVFRSAWDSDRAWYSPNGLGTYNHLGKGNLMINDVAQNICK